MRITLVLLVSISWLLFFSELAQARQYKSRLFTDSNQALSEASAKTIAELEATFSNAQDEYQIATSGQYLARQMVANKEYDKAVDYYQKTLATNALDPLIQRQLQLELANLLVHLKRYQQVLTLFIESELQEDELILLASAYNGLNQYHKAIETIKPLVEQLPQLSEQSLKQLASISYTASAFNQSIEVLTELLSRSPDDIDLARQITGLHLRQKAPDKALAIWSLTAQKGLITDEQDWLLLSDIYYQQGAPEKAGRTLQESLNRGYVNQNAKHYYRLFQFWYQARELENAKQSLWQSLRLNPDLEKAMVLAELLRQGEQWQQLVTLFEYGCQEILPDKYVGKANLLLGISYHKLGRNNEARRALINASLVSGEKRQAREWLAFIGAAPASLEESTELVGLCLPADTQIRLPSRMAKITNIETPDSKMPEDVTDTKSTAEKLEVKTLKAAKFYGQKIKASPEHLATELKKRTFSLIKNLMKSGGKVNGKMHLLFDELQQGSELEFVVAFPYRGVPANRGVSRIIKEPEITIVERQFNGPVTELAAQWQQLVMASISQGLVPTGKARLVFLSDTSGGNTLDVALQLEVKQ